MFVRRVEEAGLAQSSYFIACQASGEAVVVDPHRNTEVYEAIAEEQGFRIIAVTETHIHADFVSGARALAQQTGARLYLSDTGGPDWLYRFPHEGLVDGSEIQVGSIRLRAMATPGHTPEHLSFLLFDAGAEEAMAAITGDFVFVRDVGRPDLLEAAAGVSGSADFGARQMFRSLQHFRGLPEFLQVWPGHGAGSACGRAMAAVPGSSVGYELRTNWALKEAEEDRFVGELLRDQPEVPTYFARMKRINRDDQPLDRFVAPRRLEATDASRLILQGALVLDTRNREDFAAEHVAGSLHIEADASIGNWAGWLIAPEQDLILVADPARATELSAAMFRVGINRVLGYVSSLSGIEAPRGTAERVDLESADQLIRDGVPVMDVRWAHEFTEAHVPGALHRALGYLTAPPDGFNPDEPVLVHCRSGHRSSIAASQLRRLGFRTVFDLRPGFNGWKDSGRPVEQV